MSDIVRLHSDNAGWMWTRRDDNGQVSCSLRNYLWFGDCIRDAQRLNGIGITLEIPQELGYCDMEKDYGIHWANVVHLY